MTRQKILITGASSGIGRAAARALIAMLRNQADPADFHELVACAVVDGDSLGPAPQID